MRKQSTKQKLAKKTLPKPVSRYFWGDNLKELNWKDHKNYITKTILEKGDSNAVNWLIKKAGKAYVKKIAQKERLDKKSKTFWNFYFT